MRPSSPPHLHPHPHPHTDVIVDADIHDPTHPPPYTPSPNDTNPLTREEHRQVVRVLERQRGQRSNLIAGLEADIPALKAENERLLVVNEELAGRNARLMREIDGLEAVDRM